MDQRSVLRALVAHGLPSAGLPLPAAPPDDAAWRLIRNGLRHERLTGQAVAAADDGAWPLTDQQRSELEDDHITLMAHVLRLESDLLHADEALAAAGVPYLVLKGTAVAHLDYAEAAQRAFGDNDVLLPTDRFAEGMAVLLGLGYVRPAAELGPGFDVRFGKGATLIGERTELDVHRTLAMGPFGLLLRLDELWEAPATFEIGGRQIAALGPEQRFLHACYHAVIGNAGSRLMPFRDVAEMHLYGSHDEVRLRELAASWSAEVVLARALTDAWETLGITTGGPLVDWARTRVPTRRDARLTGVYGAGASYAAKALAGLTVLPTWGDRVAYVQMLALPGDQSLAARGRSRRSWLARGARRLGHDLRAGARSRRVASRESRGAARR